MTYGHKEDIRSYLCNLFIQLKSVHEQISILRPQQTHLSRPNSIVVMLHPCVITLPTFVPTLACILTFELSGFKRLGNTRQVVLGTTFQMLNTGVQKYYNNAVTNPYTKPHYSYLHTFTELFAICHILILKLFGIFLNDFKSHRPMRPIPQLSVLSKLFSIFLNDFQ